MSRPGHIILVRHGETVGDSSIRYHGRNDVVLSRKGRLQAEALKEILGLDVDCVVSSPLARAWQTATILAPDRDIEMEEAFAEIDFGRWEGLTRDEIAVLDPALFDLWQARPADFEFPEGEARSDFKRRVQPGIQRLRVRPVQSVLVVAHKGVVRGIAEDLLGKPLPDGIPDLAQALEFRLQSDGRWRLEPESESSN